MRSLLAADVSSAFVEDLRPEGETAPMVLYTVQTVVPGTNTPLTSITAGRDFEMRVLVQDLRNDGNANRGVYAGWLDLLYDKSLAKVRVPEIQTLTIPTAAPTTGTFTLTLNAGQTTAPINYSKANNTERAATAVDIQTKLNNLLGAGSVTVNWNGLSNVYQIRFVGLPDIDHPMLQAAPGTAATLAETVKGDPTSTVAFRESFRSRDLPGTTGTAGRFQTDVSAVDAANRVDDLGAQRASDPPPGNDPFELVRARMTAILPAGQTTAQLTLQPFFGTTANPALNMPAHETLVYVDLLLGEEDSVPPEAIISEAASLTITRALTANDGTATVGEDSLSGVAIPVLPLVTKNNGAPAGAIELRNFSQPVTGGTVQRFDPNNTPADLTDDQVRFIPAANFNGVTTFTYTAGIVGDPLPADEGTGTITVTVDADNDAPVNIVPPPQLTIEDQPRVFSAENGNLIRVTDVDADSAVVRVSLAASHGDLTLSGLTGLAFTVGDGSADATMTFSGKLTDINAALAGLSYKPALNNTTTATITITSNDLGATGGGGPKQDEDTINVSISGVNDPPVVTAPAVQNASTTSAFVFASAFGNAIVVSDVDAAADAMSVTVTATGGIGVLTADSDAGASVTGNGTANLTINGSQAAINAALDGLTLTPSTTPTTGSITVIANDLGHNPGPALTGQTTISLNVNVAIVRYRVETVLPGTNTPITSISAGGDFEVRVLVEDLRNDGNENRGVFAAFTDLLYDKSLVKVRVPEIQTLSIPAAAPVTGQFTLTLGAGQTTAAIDYSKASDAARAATAVEIQTELNALLGSGAVTVNWSGLGNQYEIRFSGLADIDHPTLQASPSEFATLAETVKGNPTNPTSFRESFRSRDLPGTTGTAGTYQNEFTALDAADRVDELGAVRGSSQPPGNAPLELIRARFTAQLAAGQFSQLITFVPFFGTPDAPAQQLPEHRTLVYADLNIGESPVVPPDRIAAVGGSISVFTPFDFGDAADTYGTTLASDGARHLGTGPFLGLARDQEADAVAGASAAGDDQSNLDDEDGVTSSLLIRGKASSLTVTASAAALLDAWIDYNNNGVFEAGEQFATSAPVAAGPNTIPFTVPAAANLGSVVARLRLSTAGGLGPKGMAQDGEVEDHILTIRQDFEVDLPSGNGVDKVALRVAGSNLEVVNLATNQVIAASPQALTRNVVLRGSATEADEITVDYGFGGFPSVLGSIQVDGGAGPGDLLTVLGSAGGLDTAHYHSPGSSLGNATLRTSQGALQTEVLFTNFEPLTISGMASFDSAANLNIGADTLTLSVTTPVTLPALTTVAAGTINAPSGLSLLTGRTLQATGTVNGSVSAATGATLETNGLLNGFVSLATGATLKATGTIDGSISAPVGSSIEVTGPLSLGRASASLTIGGNLIVGPHSVTLLSNGPVDLGAQTTLGSAAGGGTLKLATGAILSAGETIQGRGTVDSPNLAAQALVNNGSIQGNSAAERITLNGFMTGTGVLNNVTVVGTLSPGASPSAVSYGNVGFTPTSKIIVEIGGKTAGTQFDQLTFSAPVALAGTIEAVFINGFAPGIGDSFNVINSAAGVTGDFATFVKPDLPVRQRWWDDLTPTANQVQLLVSPLRPRHNPNAGTDLPAMGIRRHDVQDDGFIVANDALAIINHLNAFGSGPVPLTPGYVTPYLDVTDDNFITAQDALDIINLINAGLNVIPPGGEPGELASTPPVVSPALADTIALLAQDMVDYATRRRKSQ